MMRSFRNIVERLRYGHACWVVRRFVLRQGRQLFCRTVRTEQFGWGQAVQFFPVGYLLADEPEIIVIDIPD